MMIWLSKYGVKFGTVLTAFAAVLQAVAVLHAPFFVPALAILTAIIAFLPEPKSKVITTK